MPECMWVYMRVHVCTLVYIGVYCCILVNISVHECILLYVSIHGVYMSVYGYTWVLDTGISRMPTFGTCRCRYFSCRMFIRICQLLPSWLSLMDFYYLSHVFTHASHDYYKLVYCKTVHYKAKTSARLSVYHISTKPTYIVSKEWHSIR